MLTEFFIHGSLHGLNVLQSVLSGYFNVGLSTSAFLKLGMLVLRRCSALAWLSSGADGRLCRAALAADVAAAVLRRLPDQRRRRVGGVLAGMNLTTYGVLLLLAVGRRSADDLCGAARRPAYPLVYGRA